MVVGAGIAGLAAATGLVERGVSVDVLERENYLGGRVGGWTELLPDGTPLAMNRGFHAFFRQYYNLRDLLRRSDFGLRRLTPVDDYPLIDASGRRDTFRGLPRTPPWNALMFALRSPTFRLRDLAGLNARAAAPLAAVSVPEIYRRLDDLDADTFLQDINFPDAARHLAFEVFSRSFFAEPARLSAAELAAMFHIYFLGSSEGLVFDVASENFDTCLWDPLREYLSRRGVRFHTGVSVTGIEAPEIKAGATKAFRVHDDSGAHFDVDAVVVAADIAGLQRIVAASGDLGDEEWRGVVGDLRSAPPFVVHRLWLDRPVAADRPAFLGTGGLEPLDNVSVLDRYERQAIDWARRHGGSVIELHSYAVRDACPDGVAAGLADGLRARLHALYPETRDARVVAERTLCRADCPRVRPRRPCPPSSCRVAASRPDAGRRRHPNRPSGRADGTRRHHRLVGRQPIAERLGSCGAPVAHRSDAGPERTAAPARWFWKGSPPMRWPKTSPLRLLPRQQPAELRPTYRDAEPAIIEAALTRSQRRPAGNWYVFAASASVRKNRPFGTSVAGVEIVAWRDTDGGLHVGPAVCPHLGADLTTGTIDCGALICPWHGLRLSGKREFGKEEFGWKPLPGHDDGVLVWVRLDGRRRRPGR